MARALKDLDPEETLVVVVSKTFTTAETMLNARTVRSWLISHLGAPRRGGGSHLLIWLLPIAQGGWSHLLIWPQP